MQAWQLSVQSPIWRRPRALLAVTLLLALAVSDARADLMLNPTRVVFENNQRAAQVELMNNGTEAATYRITLVRRRMNPNGGLSAVEQPLPGELFADDLVRYSPRQVTLAPGIGQTVRIMLRKPAGLPDGEYRSHLQFDRLPPPSGRTSVEGTARENEIGVFITAMIGASIPVIVRNGATSATASLAQLQLQPGAAGQAPAVTLELRRQGSQSVYGDLTVSFTPRGGTERPLARAGGVAVYTPLQARQVRLVLPAAPLSNGILRAAYHERPEAGGKLIGETTLALP